MSPTEAVVEVLGGAKVLGRRVRDPLELAGVVREGLPFAALEALRERMEVSRKSLEETLRFSSRTLVRRRREGHLRAEESDKVYRLARVLTHATDVFEDHNAALHWLKSPNRALGMEVPLELLDTEIGAESVDDVLGRIEHGVYS